MRWLFLYGLFILSIVGLALLSGCDSNSTASKPPSTDTTDTTGPPSSGNQILIHSAAPFNFSDPFPVRPWLQTDDYKYFYSTQSKIMYCKGPVSPNSFIKISPIRINDGVLKEYEKNDGLTVHGYWGKNVYQDSLGNWHMVASPNLKRNGRGWTIIVHLSPQKGAVWGPGAPIQNWVIDKVLEGDPLASHPTHHYAAKYYRGPEGKLYLIYNMRPVNSTKNNIYAQRMKSFVKVNQNYDPVKLLVPGSYNSEYRDGTSGKKLVEAANLICIKGKYVMVYTVGDFARDNYKIGLAWSDHLLGPYKKVLRKDEKNIWGNGAGKPEVQYLLQTQKSHWPNYVKDQVKGPGVGSINRDSNGKWYLFFAAYHPFAIKRPNGKYRPSKRHPYFVQLKVNIPEKGVSNTTSYELQDWITPDKQ